MILDGGHEIEQLAQGLNVKENAKIYKVILAISDILENQEET